MAKYEFLLPDELGWKCNDEINTAIRRIMTNAGRHMNPDDSANFSQAALEVMIAEISDTTYGIIKKYQKILRR